MKQTAVLLAAFSCITIGLIQRAQCQWVPISGTHRLANWVQAIAVSGTNVYAGTDSGMYRSTDEGVTWTGINNGFPKEIVGSILVNGSDLLVGTVPGQGSDQTDSGTVYRSTDNGASWKNTGLNSADVNAIVASGTTLFAACDGFTGIGGVFRSTDNGTTWTPVNNGLAGSRAQALLMNGANLFAGTEQGINLSTNNGDSWTQIGINTMFISFFANAGNNIFAGTFGHGIYVSTNNGTNWKAVSSGLPVSSYIYGLTVSGGIIFTATSTGDFASTNNGTSWADINNGLPSGYDAAPLAVNSTYIFGGGGGDSSVWRRPLSDFASSDVKPTADVPATIELSPNPTSGVVHIRNASANELHATIHNVLGATMAASSVHGPELSIDLTDFPPGAYFVRVVADGIVNTKMIVRR